MPGINDEAADFFVNRVINVLRIAEGTVEDTFIALTQLEGEIIDELNKFDPIGPRSQVFQMRRVEKLLETTRKIINKRYSGIARTVAKSMREIAADEQRFIVSKYNKSIGVDIFDSVISPEKINKIADNSLIHPFT